MVREVWAVTVVYPGAMRRPLQWLLYSREDAIHKANNYTDHMKWNCREVRDPALELSPHEVAYETVPDTRQPHALVLVTQELIMRGPVPATRQLDNC